MSALHATTTPKPLSCTSCRQRKVKCNKVHPCTPCQKSNIECVFPQRVRVPRGRQGGSKTRDSELLRRIGRLETLVSKVDAAKAFLESRDRARESPSPEPEPEAVQRLPVDPFEDDKPGTLTENFASFIKLQESGNRYLSAQFWSTLGNEVDGLRGLLEQPQDEEDDDDVTDEAMPSGAKHDTPTFLFRDSSSNYEAQHPSDAHRAVLKRYYFTNVHAYCHVLHQPTVSSHLFETKELLDQDRRHYKFSSIEAVSFAIYFAAVTSMTEKECLEHFVEEKEILVCRYRHATEIALGKADFLTSMEVVTLTAFVLYLVATRVTDRSRSNWTLVGLAVRIAHSLGLHRDGDGTQYSAFEAEMRRRLWCQIIVLDARSCEDRGSESAIAENSFNTSLPCNLNDADFSLSSQHPLPARKGWTDMSYMLMSTDAANVIRKLNFVSFNKKEHGLSIEEKEKLIKECSTRIETLYTNGLDISGPEPPRIGSLLGRILILRLWSVLQYPFQKRKSEAGLIWPAGSALRTATNILELGMMIEQLPDTEGFLWFFRTWVPWHPVAMALAELCKNPHGELAERAWPIIEKSYKICSARVADYKGGMLWKPVRKLYKRARAVRMGRPPPTSDSSSTPASATDTTPRPSFQSPLLETKPHSLPQAQGQGQGQGPAMGVLPNGNVNMIRNLLPIPGTEESAFQQSPVGVNDNNQPINPNMFGPMSSLDWMPPTDFLMSGTETYGGPINWDDWNDFLYDANNGQSVQQISTVYNGQTGTNASPNNYYGWGHM